MKTLTAIQSSRRLIIGATLGLLTLLVAVSPWFTTVALACQMHGGGC